uniref:Defensin n=1 Tax=Anthurium amnicola TaxID=1678845 RepID=A0A1D1YJV6_9ARAE
MQYSIVSRNLIFIIFTFFVSVHMTQAAYNVSFLIGECYGNFHSYVTDCNGSVLFDEGFRDCSRGNYLFQWYDAPSLYCVHAYPQIEPKTNRYIQYTNVNACLEIEGSELSYTITDLPDQIGHCWEP